LLAEETRHCVQPGKGRGRTGTQDLLLESGFRGNENPFWATVGFISQSGGKMPLVLFEKDKEILRVSLNRTPALNAINSTVLQELENGLKDHLTDPDIRGLLLFGQGGCFASGADIRELSSLSEEGIRSFHRLRERTFALLENFPCPTIAVIQRYALGTGLELALCCDFRLAAADARLGIPSARLGLVESYEYFTRAVRAAGPAWTRRMVFTGDPVDADTALRIGLVEEVSPPEYIFERTDQLLAKILKNSFSAIRQTKRVIADCARDPNLLLISDPALPLVDSTRTPDFKAATQAFIKKREKG
jgi:enoyl-CoA hydratase